MPSSAAHGERARDNEAFAAALDLASAIQRSWAVVALFYSALHWVEAYLATKDMHPGNHMVRSRLAGTDTNLRPIYLHYRELEDMSRHARYELRPFTEEQVRELRLRHLTAVKERIATLLTPRPPTPDL